MADLDEGISDELLEKASTDIQKLLKKRGLSESERVQLEVQSYFLMFLINDHKKIAQMYPFFKTERDRREKNRAWWEKLQWIVVPMGAAAVIGFIGQFINFWITVVPKIIK